MLKNNCFFGISRSVRSVESSAAEILFSHSMRLISHSKNKILMQDGRYSLPLYEARRLLGMLAKFHKKEINQILRLLADSGRIEFSGARINFEVDEND